MVWLEKIHAPGRPVTGTVSWPLWPTLAVLRLTVTAVVAVAGGRRCGRTTLGMMNWTAAKTARVTAMAGRVRRMMTPAVTPRAKPNAA